MSSGLCDGEEVAVADAAGGAEGAAVGGEPGERPHAGREPRLQRVQQ